MENGVFGYEWNNVECVLMLAEEGCRILIFRSLGANYSSVLADDFPGQVQVILGPRRVGIVQDDRQTVARTFAELHVSLNHRLEDQLLEVPLHLVVNLVSQTQTTVVHRQEKTFDFQLRVQFALNNLDGVEQFTDTFQGEIFTLHGNDDRVGCRERVYRNQTQ